MILDDLVASTKKRVELSKRKISPEEMMDMAKKCTYKLPAFAFEEALKTDEEMHFICEVKKASPSKGLIAPDFPYTEIAKDYEEAGASCISVLTEPEYFMGDIEYLKEIRGEVNIPLLRKDFTIDPYMIYEAKVSGADAVLLIAAILTDEKLREYKEIADGLGLSCIFEAHDSEEVKRCVNAGARILGVNNRDLRDFTVDIHNCLRYMDDVPDNVLFVAESGIHSHDDIAELAKYHVDAVLVGESLMRASDRQAALKSLKGQ